MKKIIDLIQTPFSRGMVLSRLKHFCWRQLGLAYKRSYAQCGEDVIARTVFDLLGIAHPTYLDIGAHDPKYLSNTYLFYREGSRGINVEPDPVLYRRLKRARPRDINLNIGVGNKAGTLTLNIMSVRTLNTFSMEEADTYERQGYRIIAKRSVPIVTVNDLIEKYLGMSPDLLSVDVEGLDYTIIESLDMKRYRPALICVETIVFSTSGLGEKRIDIDELLKKWDYIQFADTYVNTLYVDRARWVNR